MISIYGVFAQHKPLKNAWFIWKVFVHQNMLPGICLLFLHLVPAWSLKTRRSSGLDLWIVRAFFSGLAPRRAL